MNNSDLFLFNGIDGDTGAPFYPPLPRSALRRLALSAPVDRATAQRQRRKEGPHLGLRYGLDARDLRQAGWGIVFPRDADPEVRKALEPLIEHRQQQIGDERRCRVFEGEEGYRPDMSWIDFRNDHGGGPDEVDPVKIPFYLLLVGDPESIPFEFQLGLDLQHAVGRLSFDTAEEYARYAAAVVGSETSGAATASRRLTFFGARNPGDVVMEMTADYLIPQVAGFLAENRKDWSIETRIGEEATRSRLAGLLGGEDKPAVLFTATHGVGFKRGDARQRDYQGALVCQDTHFAAEHLGAEASPAGLIAFLFACHGAGTPHFDGYPEEGKPPAELTDHPFVARLPQRLLGHPRGGALAVIGHVDRAWCHSFLWNGEAECQAFESALLRLLDGYPVGAALEPFATRYSHLSAELQEEKDLVQRGKIDDQRLLELWTSANDSRNYTILGDPAVRLPGTLPRE